MGLAAALCSFSRCPLRDAFGCWQPPSGAGAGAATPAPAPGSGSRFARVPAGWQRRSGHNRLNPAWAMHNTSGSPCPTPSVGSATPGACPGGVRPRRAAATPRSDFPKLLFRSDKELFRLLKASGSLRPVGRGGAITVTNDPGESRGVPARLFYPPTASLRHQHRHHRHQKKKKKGVNCCKVSEHVDNLLWLLHFN